MHLSAWMATSLVSHNMGVIKRFQVRDFMFRSLSTPKFKSLLKGFVTILYRHTNALTTNFSQKTGADKVAVSLIYPPPPVYPQRTRSFENIVWISVVFQFVHFPCIFLLWIHYKTLFIDS